MKSHYPAIVIVAPLMLPPRLGIPPDPSLAASASSMADDLPHCQRASSAVTAAAPLGGPSPTGPPPVGGGEMTPQNGDLLVANPTATLDYDVTTVGESVSLACANCAAAVAQAVELARQRRVDAWLTEDHTHFLKIASCRETAGDRHAGAPEPDTTLWGKIRTTGKNPEQL
jgi:hypothetical protein